MKLGAQSAPAPAAEPSPAPQAGAEAPTTPQAEPSSDKPFDDQPFDAGVEADEQSDPKKYIEQLSGKLGQSLRKYTEEQGQPDFELEKFAVNSLLAATHTSEMDSEDQNDIIKKVKTAGNHDDNKGDTEDVPTDDSDTSGGSDSNDASMDMDAPNDGGEENVAESKKKDDEFLFKPKKMSIFAPEGSEEAKFNIKKKLDETFNQDKMVEPAVQPIVKPAPTKTPAPMQPSRKNKPFLPSPSVQPAPKAMKEVDQPKEKEGPNTTALAHELASMSKNVNDLITKQNSFFTNKKVDAADMSKIIAHAAEIVKNR